MIDFFELTPLHPSNYDQNYTPQHTELLHCRHMASQRPFLQGLKSRSPTSTNCSSHFTASQCWLTNKAHRRFRNFNGHLDCKWLT